MEYSITSHIPEPFTGRLSHVPHLYLLTIQFALPQWVQARSSILSVAIQSTLPTFGHTAYYSIIKPAQAEGVEAALQSQDVSAYIPMRYGKSLVYQMLPLSARYILESLGKSARLKPCMRTEPLVAFLLMSFTSSRFTNTLPGCVRFANLCWRLSHR